MALRLAPLLLVLALQASLLFANLALLPIWTDELFTLQTVTQPVGRILEILQRDIHPPLYYLLLHTWPWRTLDGLRAFSGLWAMAATVLLDRLWLAGWHWRRRAVALGLFALSPCLLLYGRMARSYAMQTALAIVAVWLLWRWMRTGKWLAAAWAGLLAVLYTHYVPGIALAIGFAAAAAGRQNLRKLALFFITLTAGYAPWLLTLGVALGRWGEAGGFSSQYTLTGNRLTEQAVKLGYGLTSLTIGESFSGWSLPLVALALYLVWRGARRAAAARPRLVVLIGASALAGYAGVARWVSYPFIPARLLWLLPFLVLAVGRECRRRAWPAVLLLASGASGVWFYFAEENFVNKGYAAPLRELAARLGQEAGPEDVVLLDAYNTDGYAFLHYWRGPARAKVLFEDKESETREMLGTARNVFVVRNARDISPGWVTTRLEMAACRERSKRVELFEPYQEWQRAAMRFVGLAHPPTHFYQLTICRQQ